jgi:hypothetical protein
MAKYFNTAFSLSMVVPPFVISGSELTPAEASKWLNQEIQNVANPNHANTLDAVSKKLGTGVRDAKGGRVVLSSGDECLVAQVSFPPSVPRETKEYTDEQVALGKFSFVLVKIE